MFKKQITILVIVVLSSICLASSGNNPKIAYSKEFKSENGEYVVTVGYEDWGGQGNAHYTAKDKEGEIISKFTTDVAPFFVYVSNNGKRLIAFGGDWTENAFIDKMIFYDFKGNIIKKYDLDVSLDGESSFSKDGKIFVVGLGYDLLDYLKHLDRKKIQRINVLVLFNVSSGEIIRQIPIEGIENICEIILSHDAEWILMRGDLKDYWKNGEFVFAEYIILLFDKNGKKHWEEVIGIPAGKILRFGEFSGDGTSFEVYEIMCEYDEKKEIHKYTVDKKTMYKNVNGKVKLEKTIKSNEKWEGK
jgi:hypothetical protein